MCKTTPDVIFAFGFRTHFGGGKTTKFGIIYMKKNEPKQTCKTWPVWEEDLKNIEKGRQEQNEETRGTAKANAGAGTSGWSLDGRRNKDSTVTFCGDCAGFSWED